jgi:hypothetical protein
MGQTGRELKKDPECKGLRFDKMAPEKIPESELGASFMVQTFFLKRLVGII